MEDTNKTDGKTSTESVGVTETQVEQLNKLEAEMMACYNGWDGAIKNKAQPVSIQDLEYWAGVCRNLALDLKEAN